MKKVIDSITIKEVEGINEVEIPNVGKIDPNRLSVKAVEVEDEI